MTPLVQDAKISSETLCLGCAEYFPSEDVVEVRLNWRGGTSILLRCRECSTEPLCEDNYNGIHGEIIDAEDIEFDNRVLIPDTSLPDYQLGYCRNCKWPFFWSVPRQCWTAMEMK